MSLAPVPFDWDDVGDDLVNDWDNAWDDPRRIDHHGATPGRLPGLADLVLLAASFLAVWLFVITALSP